MHSKPQGMGSSQGPLQCTSLILELSYNPPYDQGLWFKGNKRGLLKKLSGSGPERELSGLSWVQILPTGGLDSLPSTTCSPEATRSALRAEPGGKPSIAGCGQTQTRPVVTIILELLRSKSFGAPPVLVRIQTSCFLTHIAGQMGSIK